MKLPWKAIGGFIVKQVAPVVISAMATAIATRAVKPAAPAKAED